MYALASNMHHIPIISLQSGEAIGRIIMPVLDASTLEIIAFRCQTLQSRHDLILTPHDVRQLAADCIIIDSEDELSEPGDIIRLKDTIKANYTPVGKTVITDSHRKLGQVEDFSINIETYRVQKLYIRTSLFQAWIGSNLVIDRNQIVDVTPKHIIVRDSSEKAPILATDPVPEINP